MEGKGKKNNMKKVVKQTYFQNQWLDEPEFKDWLVKGSSTTTFGCKWCKLSDQKLSNNGRRAVSSHMASGRHEASSKLHDQLKNFFDKRVSTTTPKASASSVSEAEPPCSSQGTLSSATSESSSSLSGLPDSTPAVLVESSIDLTISTSGKAMQQSTITHAVENSQTLRADIIWVTTSVMKNFSNNVSRDMNQTFSAMFPDSRIANNFNCGADKLKYLTNFGVAPWVKEQLQKEVENCKYLVIGFDESLNRSTQTCQMDLNVRYWDSVDCMVKVRFYDSKFIGHSTHSDLLKNYKDATTNINLVKILQISMDGPAVNMKFYNCVVEDRDKTSVGTKMIDIGSCGLHIIHGSFKTAFESTDWGMKAILKGSYTILHDTPARRDDYLTVTSCELYPLAFCATRWVEDKKPADRLREIWPSMKKIFSFWLSLAKSKQPKGKSFEAVKNAVEDPLTPAKLSFFSYVASLMQPFLTKYQTPKPMIPYLHTDLSKLYKALMKIVIKDDIVDKCSASELTNTDMEKSENIKKVKNFTIGFVTEGIVKELVKKDDLTDEQQDDFYENIKICMVKLIGKLNERSPLKSVVVRNSSVFNPLAMVKTKLASLQKRLKLLLQHLASLNLVKASNCDTMISQYASLKNDVDSSPIDVEEVFPEKRLDEFFFKSMKVGSKYPELSEVMIIIFTLSHGQADIERGFSLNNGTLQTNIQESSVVSKRLIKDHMIAHGLKPYDMEITPDLMASCRRARTRYHHFLEEERKQKDKKSSETEKELLNQEIEELEVKIAQLERSRSVLDKKFEAIVLGTEKMKQNEDVVNAVTEANALKRKAIEQGGDIRKLQETLHLVTEKRRKIL